MALGKNLVKTWVHGMDSVLGGGIPSASQVVLGGDPGAGKTLLTLEILYNNAKAGIPSTFATFDESKEQLIEEFKSAFPEKYGIDEVVASGKIAMTESRILEPIKTNESLIMLISTINDAIKSNKSRIVAIDSLSQLRPLSGSERQFTQYVNHIAYTLKGLGLTGLHTLETTFGDRPDDDLLFGFSAFDGLIMLSAMQEAGEHMRVMRVVKLRQQNHIRTIKPYEITPTGINVFE